MQDQRLKSTPQEARLSAMAIHATLKSLKKADKYVYQTIELKTKVKSRACSLGYTTTAITRCWAAEV